METEGDALFGADYEVAKKVVYDELEQWMNTAKGEHL
jgi:hypothetical protein